MLVHIYTIILFSYFVYTVKFYIKTYIILISVLHNNQNSLLLRDYIYLRGINLLIYLLTYLLHGAESFLRS